MSIKHRINRHGLEEWGIDYRYGGRGSPRRQIWGFTSQAAAEKYQRDLLITRKQKQYGLLPFAAPFLKDLLEKHANTIERPKEQQKARRIFREFLKVLPPQIATVTDLATPDIEIYSKKRAADGVSPGTIRRELTIISAALHSAHRHYRELSQWIAPKIVYPRNSRRRRERIIETHEIQALLTWCLRPKELGEHQSFFKSRRRVGLVFLFALLTAARLGEIARLRWSDVKVQRGVVEIIGTKTEFSKDTVRAREIELTKTIKWIIDERREDADSGTEGSGEYVFFKGGNVTPKYYKVLKVACEAAGVPYGKGEANGILTHHARHSAVTLLLQNGLDIGSVMNATGSSAQFVLWYAKATATGRARVGETLEKAISWKAGGE